MTFFTIFRSLQAWNFLLKNLVVVVDDVQQHILPITRKWSSFDLAYMLVCFTCQSPMSSIFISHIENSPTIGTFTYKMPLCVINQSSPTIHIRSVHNIWQRQSAISRIASSTQSIQFYGSIIKDPKFFCIWQSATSLD